MKRTRKINKALYIILLIILFAIIYYYISDQFNTNKDNKKRNSQEKASSKAKSSLMGIKTFKNIPEFKLSDSICYQVFFSLAYNDAPQAVENEIENVDKYLIRLIRTAKKSINMCIHELDLQFIAEELITAKENGVKVRIVLEEKYKDEPAIIMLTDADIPVVLDENTALMHNKFVIVDDIYVWTGSYNFTYNCSYKNNNNAIIIKNAELAKDYLTEFEEMFEDKLFGPSSPKDIPYEKVILCDGTEIKPLFAPENDVENCVLEELNTAREEILLMSFSFTSKRISKLLIRKKDEGIKVTCIIEKNQKNVQGSVFEELSKKKVSIYIDKNKFNMHHKVIIIDRKTVITGSYNFTESANKRNDENLLIIKNSSISSPYITEFNKILGESVS